MYLGCASYPDKWCWTRSDLAIETPLEIHSESRRVGQSRSVRIRGGLALLETRISCPEPCADTSMSGLTASPYIATCCAPSGLQVMMAQLLLSPDTCRFWPSSQGPAALLPRSDETLEPTQYGCWTSEIGDSVLISSTVLRFTQLGHDWMIRGHPGPIANIPIMFEHVASGFSDETAAYRNVPPKN
jgi:hypothetical protein